MKKSKVKSKETYEALLAAGWSKPRIAKEFGISRQAVHNALTYRSIPWEMRDEARFRDSGECSLCTEETYNVKVIDLSKPVTLDNIGLLCGRCAFSLSKARRQKHISYVCRLPGCGATFAQTRGTTSSYCSLEHRKEAIKARGAARIAKSRIEFAATTEKECTHCLVVKPITEFYVRTSVAGVCYWYAHCRSCHLALTRKNAAETRKDPVKYEKFKTLQKASTKKYQEKILRTKGREFLRQRAREAYRKWRVRHGKVPRVDASVALQDPKVQELVAQLKKML